MTEIQSTRTLLAAAVCLLLLGAGTRADAKEMTGKFRVEGALFLGAGGSRVEVGKTAIGDSVTISGGGGAGGSLTFGYGLVPRLDIEITAGTEKSMLTPAVVNATGSFDRNFYLISLMYRIPLSDRLDFKVGGGAGLYEPKELDIDASGATNGFHDVVRYGSATGTHVIVAFEIFVDHDVSVTFGAKYYSVTYKESSGSRNGVPGFFTNSDIVNFDGSGFDLTAAIAKYF